MKYLRKFNEDIYTENSITVDTLPTCEEHEEYPKLTFIMNDRKPSCESCGQLEYGTPYCSMDTNWCLNCIQNMGYDIISDEDADKIWKESKYFSK